MKLSGELEELVGRFHSIWVLLAFLSFATLLFSQGKLSPEQRAGRYFQQVRNQPLLAMSFLREMPKGGDLHNHLAGAIYAESWIRFAAEDKLCLDRATSVLVPGPCDASCEHDPAKPAAECAFNDPALYNQMIDAWSMRNWERGRESGHDHFFATFDRFELVVNSHLDEQIAEAMRRAAADDVTYLELMHTAGGLQPANLGEKLGWTPDFALMREKLLAGGLKPAIAAARAEVDTNDERARQILGCKGTSPEPACQVTVRYLYQVLRGFPPEQVFAQILTGFELASIDPRVVGLNLVMPEDSFVPMRDFDLHMKMLDYLHRIYPHVHISLHAGELARGLVPPDGLQFHIRESVEVGHAERIGHGVDIMYEREPLQLLEEMAKRNILVEINLTSNDVILGVKGNEQPLPVYRRYNVPVALSTDDEGVSRSDMTQEYVRGASTYALSYLDLKAMARQSIEHSFLPGASLWSDVAHGRMTTSCNANQDAPQCADFLHASEKAREQWKLEKQFAEFEKKF